MGGLVSTVGSMVGVGGSAAAKGMNWAPTGANLGLPVTEQQATDAYNQSQGGIKNQADFLAALQAQNGIGNQSGVYNQLQGVANGTGPNPAQAMLSNATGANVANQAALMAGQRGAGANVGLMARQAAQQGGSLQQQAAGQGAALQAQQSLGALSQMGGLSSQQVGQQAAATGALTGAQQSEQGLLLGGINNQNNSLVSQQNAMNQANLSQAQAGAKAQQGVLQGVGMAAGMPGLAHGGAVPHYYGGTPNGVGSPSLGVNTNLGMPPIQQPNGSPTAPPAPTKYARAAQTALGANDKDASKQPDPFEQGGKSVGQGIGTGLKGLASGIKGLFGGSSAGGTDNSDAAYRSEGAAFDNEQDAASKQMWSDNGFAHGGKVPAMVSPGEVYIPPREVEEVKRGKKDPISAGEKIPGKAKVKGDSLKNDTVPKTLEEGGIVLPKSVMEAKHPHWEAHKFVSAILAKQGLKGRK